jgi:hypothetical protein
VEALVVGSTTKDSTPDSSICPVANATSDSTYTMLNNERQYVHHAQWNCAILTIH